MADSNKSLPAGQIACRLCGLERANASDVEILCALCKEHVTTRFSDEVSKMQKIVKASGGTFNVVEFMRDKFVCSFCKWALSETQVAQLSERKRCNPSGLRCYACQKFRERQIRENRALFRDRTHRQLLELPTCTSSTALPPASSTASSTTLPTLSVAIKSELRTPSADTLPLPAADTLPRPLHTTLALANPSPPLPPRTALPEHLLVALRAASPAATSARPHSPTLPAGPHNNGGVKRKQPDGPNPSLIAQLPSQLRSLLDPTAAVPEPPQAEPPAKRPRPLQADTAAAADIADQQYHQQQLPQLEAPPQQQQQQHQHQQQFDEEMERWISDVLSASYTYEEQREALINAEFGYFKSASTFYHYIPDDKPWKMADVAATKFRSGQYFETLKWCFRILQVEMPSARRPVNRIIMTLRQANMLLLIAFTLRRICHQLPVFQIILVPGHEDTLLALAEHLYVTAERARSEATQAAGGAETLERVVVYTDMSFTYWINRSILHNKRGERDMACRCIETVEALGRDFETRLAGFDPNSLADLCKRVLKLDDTAQLAPLIFRSLKFNKAMIVSSVDEFMELIAQAQKDDDALPFTSKRASGLAMMLAGLVQGDEEKMQEGKRRVEKWHTVAKTQDSYEIQQARDLAEQFGIDKAKLLEYLRKNPVHRIRTASILNIVASKEEENAAMDLSDLSAGKN